MVDLRWHPGIGDPTPVGWLTVAAYAVVAVLCAHAAVVARRAERRYAGLAGDVARDERDMKHLWLLAAVTMALLGVNKQLDLQTLLIQNIRRRAYVDGWYGDRRRYQKDFIVVVSAIAFVGVLAVSVWLRRVLRRVLLAIAGLGMLVVFVIVRASSFHYVDKVLSLGGRIRVNWALELGGIALISASVLHWHATERRAQREIPIEAPSVAKLRVPTGA